MKKSVFLIISFVLSAQFLWAQKIPEGKVITTSITAKTLKNKAGENPERRVSVYLPPDYEKSTKRYPLLLTWLFLE